MPHSEPYIQYNSKKDIVTNISKNLEKILTVSPAARICIDSPYGIQERLIIDLGLKTQTDHLLHNLSLLLYEQMMRHYISSDPKSSHHGIANQMLEGFPNSAFKKETEAILNKVQERADLAGSVLRYSIFEDSLVPVVGQIQGLVLFLKKHLDIHIGYQIKFEKNRYESQTIFLPLEKDSLVIQQLIINLEKILLLHYSYIDETSRNSLNLTETMVLKDVQCILNRAKSKQGTKEKLLENIDPSVSLPNSHLNKPVYSYLKKYHQLSSDYSEPYHPDVSIAAYTIKLNDLLNVEGASILQVQLGGTDHKPTMQPDAENDEKSLDQNNIRSDLQEPASQDYWADLNVFPITLEAAKANVLQRSYVYHPLKKRFLLYPYKSDFEKTFAKSQSDEHALHPKVENFINRKFARRTSVSHPLQNSKGDTPRRRHYDKKLADPASE